MNFPTWTKPVLFGAAIGAVAATILGFTAGGWVTESKAEVVANEQARAEVSEALLPICLELSKMDDERMAKIEKIRAKPSYQRTDELMSAGWTTMPGTETSDRRVATACLEALLK